MATLQRIFQLVGPVGVGKTTVCRLLASELSLMAPEASILMVDASDDEGLTTLAAPQSQEISLASVLASDASAGMTSQLAKAQLTRERMDWALSEAVVSVNESLDLLLVGPLADVMPTDTQALLAYGFNRLMAAYHYVLVDGSHPLLDALLFAHEGFRRVVVVSPQRPFWQQDALVQTPALLLNQTPEGPLPESLQQSVGPLLRAGELQLIGKLPPGNTETLDADALCAQLSPVFKDCLYRLDLPRSGAHL